MKKLRLSVLLSFFISTLYAQKIRCASEINVDKISQFQEKINQKVANFKVSALREDEIIRIPVVVHIIHNNMSGKVGGNDNSNISNEQILSQIDVLNEDFRRKLGSPGFNNNPIGADMQIEFFLANIDPQGHATTGINRVYTSKRSFNVFSEALTLSNLSYWDSNKYLNIWVTTISGGYLGAAEFPTADFEGLDTTETDERTDGVIIDHRSFGRQIGTVESPYNFGRTATHEIGHWLGLIHIWGDARCGTDFCDDTPTADGPNNTLVCTELYSNCRGRTTRNMIENYLDYTVDSCMNIFTQDQKLRVRAVLELSNRRKTLLQNADLFQKVSEPLNLKVLGNPVNDNSLKLKIFVDKAKDYRVEVVDLYGKTIYSELFTNSLSRMITIPKQQIGFGLLLLRVSTTGSFIEKRIVSI